MQHKRTQHQLHWSLQCQCVLRSSKCPQASSRPKLIFWVHRVLEIQAGQLRPLCFGSCFLSGVFSVHKKHFSSQKNVHVFQLQFQINDFTRSLSKLETLAWEVLAMLFDPEDSHESQVELSYGRPWLAAYEFSKKALTNRLIGFYKSDDYTNSIIPST